MRVQKPIKENQPEFLAMKMKYNIVSLPLSKLNDAIRECVEVTKLTPVVFGPEAVLSTFFFDEEEGEYNHEVVPIDVRYTPPESS